MTRYKICPGSGKTPTGNVFRNPKYSGPNKNEGWRAFCPNCNRDCAVTPREKVIIRHRSTSSIGVSTTTKPTKIRNNKNFKRPDEMYAFAYNAAIQGSVIPLHGKAKPDGDLAKAWVMGTLDGYGDTGNEKGIKEFKTHVKERWKIEL